MGGEGEGAHNPGTILLRAVSLLQINYKSHVPIGKCFPTKYTAQGAGAHFKVHCDTLNQYPNQKPWMNKEVWLLLKARNTAFRSGDTQAYSTSRANLMRGIKKAKYCYKLKVEEHFSNSDPRRMWQGTQAINNYKPSNSTLNDTDVSFLNKLNDFYAHFERDNKEKSISTRPSADHQPFTLTSTDVYNVLSRINARKAAGPDGIPGRVLRACAEQLAGVFTDIFYLSLAHSVMPTCFKSTSIVPVPKHSSPKCLNDYRTVALTPIVMKCFERLVLAHLKKCLPPHWTHTNLPITAKGAQRMQPPQCCTLSGHICSTTITLNTGVPQGCVLSPFLYSLFTHDCRPVYGSNSIIKFADDTTVIGLISDDETAYRAEVQHLVAWCADNNLLLNISKTKELIIDFRREKGRTHDPIHINGMAVERVSSFKFLGTHISEDLSWTTNTSSLVKKAHQCLFLPKHSEEKPPVFNHPGELLLLRD
ncbi:hypothetical protein QTP70_010719 [Hemibagrus guttatus]|uniref:Reverse transcriptase domain-containing protein n=1 Tax=Hemibagrus guttatus TaxID=175788 RepID=A0AAE0PVP7_9TELE|nr:hypothetical protein QTP70_010719 [Hemibagrus guttatus]